jgi:ribosomal protein S5
VHLNRADERGNAQFLGPDLYFDDLFLNAAEVGRRFLSVEKIVPTEDLLKNGTIHHAVQGQHGAARIMMMPAPKGTGIIAGGPMRAVFEVMGITDIVAKSHGSTNPYNMVRATFDALRNSTTPSEVAAKRGKSVEDLFAA